MGRRTTGTNDVVMWCEAVELANDRYQTSSPWRVHDDGREAFQRARRAQLAEAYFLVAATNQLQLSLHAVGRHDLRRLLPFNEIYRLRCLYEHRDEESRVKYETQVGPHGASRASGGNRPPQIGDVDFGPILEAVATIRQDLEVGSTPSTPL